MTARGPGAPFSTTSGEMARLVRDHDWSATPLGACEGWPQSLRTAVDIVLGSGHAMQLAWGAERIIIYNDAYAPMLGDRHPGALGLRFREAWPDVWTDIEPLVERVFAGETVRFEDMPLVMTRHGYPEETWWNFSYSPVRDESGAVAGLLNVTVDATGRVRAERAETERDESRRLQSAMLDVLPLGLALVGTEGTVLLSNPEWDRFVPGGRLPSQDPERMRRWRAWDGDGRPVAPHDFPGARALRGERCLPGMEFLHTDETGTETWANVASVPLRDPQGGLAGAVAIVMDIDAAKRAREALRRSEERQSFLLGLSDALRPLAQSDDIEAAAMRRLADRLDVLRASYFEVEADQESVRMTAQHERDPAPIAERMRLSDFGPDVAAALRRGETLVFRDTEAEVEIETQLGSLTDHRPIGARAWVAVPLVKDGRLIAIVAVHSARPRAWTPEEIALVHEVADRTSAAVERARAEASLRESGERQAFLLRLSDALRTLGDPIAVQEAAAQALGAHLGVDRAAYVGLDEERRVATVAQEFRRGDIPSLAGRHGFATLGAMLDRLRAGKPVVVEDIETEPGIRPADLAVYRALGLRALLNVTPPFNDDKRVCAMCVVSATPRRWTAAEIALVEETAERTWAAVERARAEAGLRESQRLQSAMLEVLPLGLALVGADGRVILSNPEWARFVPGDRMPSGDPDRPGRWRATDARSGPVAPEDFPAARALRGEAVVPGIELLYTDDAGAEVWTNVASVPLLDEKGGVVGAVAIVHDIDAAKRAADALGRSEEQFRLIVENARDYAIFTADRDGRIDAWPPGAALVFGWSEAEALGQPFAMTFTAEDRAEGAPERELETARTRGVAPDVRWHVRKDGAPIYIDGSTRALLDASGEVSGFLKIGQDVTARRATEQALVESEERFRHFADTSADIIWIGNADSLQYEYVSPAFERVYGDSFERVLSGNDFERWLELVLPENRATVRDAFRRVLAGEHVTHEFRVIRPSDGEVRWIRNSDFPLRDSTGRVHRIGGIGHDSTEEKLSAERMAVMVAELQHRTRNLIAVVRSIADQTIRTTGEIGAFQEKFGERLAALARVQGLLSRSDEEPITVRALIAAELDALGAGELGPGRVALVGPSVRLRNTIVQTLALALHELATNARKYGALAGNDGRLEVVWSVGTEAETGHRLMLSWTETAPHADAGHAEGRGYGRYLIERALPYALGARTAYSLADAGVHCTIDLPLDG